MSIDKEKLALLIPCLASNHDGEVVATARVISRVLNAAGNDLHDLAQIVLNGSAEVRRGPLTLQLRDLLCNSLLTDWEREFLTSLIQQDARRPGFRPSDKQQASLDRIFRKCHG